MGVSPGRSRVSDTSVHVFGRVVHPDWFTVRAHRRIARTGWEADVRIIDGGHAITWGSGEARVTEVLAGPETPMPDLGRMFQAPVRRERSVRLRPEGRVEYQTCFAVERLDPEVFGLLSEELERDAARGDLFHQFGPSSRLAPAPISRVHIEPRGRGISIQAFHTFPDERAIVRTQSLFEIAAPGKK